MSKNNLKNKFGKNKIDTKSMGDFSKSNSPDESISEEEKNNNDKTNIRG